MPGSFPRKAAFSNAQHGCARVRILTLYVLATSSLHAWEIGTSGRRFKPRFRYPTRGSAQAPGSVRKAGRKINLIKQRETAWILVDFASATTAGDLDIDKPELFQ
jgi:hypothetical protein